MGQRNRCGFDDSGNLIRRILGLSTLPGTPLLALTNTLIGSQSVFGNGSCWPGECVPDLLPAGRNVHDCAENSDY